MKSLACAVAIVLALPSAASIALATSQDTERVYQGKEVAVLPVVTYDAKPKYSAEAMRQAVTGEVVVEGVVRRDGHVTDIRVVRALHPDLDREAVETFGKWTFKPGRLKNGEAVPVQISVMMAFQLRGGPDRIYEPGPDVTAPTIVTEVKPVYPQADQDAGRTGAVGLECIVRRDGTPSDIVVTKPLYPSLDEAAVAALKQWRFKPGARGLTNVSVRIQLTMSFDLR
jgi:TonB family protein